LARGLGLRLLAFEHGPATDCLEAGVVSVVAARHVVAQRRRHAGALVHGLTVPDRRAFPSGRHCARSPGELGGALVPALSAAPGLQQVRLDVGELVVEAVIVSGARVRQAVAAGDGERGAGVTGPALPPRAGRPGCCLPPRPVCSPYREEPTGRGGGDLLR
jgi:hypothetical protein